MQKVKKVEKKKMELVKVRTGNYHVGDFLVSLKNACLSGRKEIEAPKTRLIKSVAETLFSLGFLREVKEEEAKLIIKLAYRKKEPILSDIRLISKPGLRRYIKAKELERRKEPSVLILSTPKGVMSSEEALKKRVGGEIIAEVL